MIPKRACRVVVLPVLWFTKYFVKNFVTVAVVLEGNQQNDYGPKWKSTQGIFGKRKKKELV